MRVFLNRRCHPKCLMIFVVSVMVAIEILCSITFVTHIPIDAFIRGKVRRSVNTLTFFATGRKPPDFSECKTIELRPPQSFALVALVGYPRSGVTWSRLLIQRATGVYTSTVHKAEMSKARMRKLFPAGDIDYHHGRTVCVKTHRYEPQHINEFEAAMLVLRDPFEAIFAEAVRSGEIRNTENKTAVIHHIQSNRWKSYVMREGLRWRNTYIQWIDLSKSTLVIHLPSLEANTFDNLKEIVRFLNIPVKPERLQCAVERHQASSFVESDKTLLENIAHDPFNQELRSLLQEYIQDVNVSLYQKGLSTLPSNFGIELEQDDVGTMPPGFFDKFDDSSEFLDDDDELDLGETSVKNQSNEFNANRGEGFGEENFRTRPVSDDILGHKDDPKDKRTVDLRQQSSQISRKIDDVSVDDLEDGGDDTLKDGAVDTQPDDDTGGYKCDGCGE